ncbi:hypothetical protein CERSUDRAFT_99934 [Gelatoporia subvermispora B]|uniref:Uncharacterized protein n=1 Tax=Ceriporiopsis subvermispora (strain B) TaxID=914234 RepID=M2QIQ0_CERS8|nr:hypothetical protein CERSUDRAFT_99934 [Gelatoporia subvermispora B]
MCFEHYQAGLWSACGHWDANTVTYNGPEWCHIKLEDVTAPPTYCGPRYTCPSSDVFHPIHLPGLCTPCLEQACKRQFYFQKLLRLVANNRQLSLQVKTQYPTRDLVSQFRTRDDDAMRSRSRSRSTEKKEVSTADLFLICSGAHHAARQKSMMTDKPTSARDQSPVYDPIEARSISVTEDPSRPSVFDRLRRISRHRKAESLSISVKVPGSQNLRGPATSSLIPAKKSDRENWRERRR